MNLTIWIDDYNPDYVLFGEYTKNNIIQEADFIRIIYSTSTMSLSGVYVRIRINELSCDKFYNKHRCIFDIVSHADLITKLGFLEESILKKLRVENKTPQYKLYDQLKVGNIKVNEHIEETHDVEFLLKISGVWVTDNKYGLTYKFILLKEHVVYKT